MTFANIFDAVSTLTLLVGVVFGLIQLRQFRHAREREGALEFLRSFQSPQMTAALRRVFELPSGLSGEEIEAALANDMDLVYGLITTWESIGILVFRNQARLDLVDDFFSGPIRLSWQKLHPLVTRMRALTGRATISEWFQWLADRMAEREDATPPQPAHIAHRDWHPRRG
jgi:hypothetical protein